MISSGQKNRLKKLVYNWTIPSDLYDKLNFIRIIRNKAVHGHIMDVEDNANKVHAYLYLISAYFFQKYKNPDFIVPEYKGPIMETDSSPTKSEKVLIKILRILNLL